MPRVHFPLLSAQVMESIECLRGRGPADTMEVTFALGELMLMLCGLGSRAHCRLLLEQSISSGAALAKFKEMVAAQVHE
jgi:pyrimidine-nucleoside phosphorylase